MVVDALAQPGKGVPALVCLLLPSAFHRGYCPLSSRAVLSKGLTLTLNT